MTYSRKSLVALLLLLVPLVVEAQQLETRRDVNLRKGTSTKNAVVTTVDSGAVVEQLLTRSGYDRVQTPDGTKGWIYGRLLQPVTAVVPAPAPAPSPTPP